MRKATEHISAKARRCIGKYTPRKRAPNEATPHYISVMELPQYVPSRDNRDVRVVSI